ncbi:hypothetical protein Tco_0162012 [Tanacetum coccineum]
MIMRTLLFNIEGVEDDKELMKLLRSINPRPPYDKKMLRSLRSSRYTLSRDGVLQMNGAVTNCVIGMRNQDYDMFDDHQMQSGERSVQAGYFDWVQTFRGKKNVVCVYE